MRVAIDAMGGDRAPEEIVKGAVRAANSLEDVLIFLVGDKKRIEKIICEEESPRPANIEALEASQVVEMDEKPARAIIKKRNSSVVKAADLVARNEADAFISAGNTGAAVAAAIIRCGLLEGVKRAGIAVSFALRNSGMKTIIDVGANIHCKAIHLFQYAIMGSVYMSNITDEKSPAVGLVNIGTEEPKGTQLIQETREMLMNSPLNFIGNIEGNDIHAGRCKVIVCEGFTGNVILKVTEGLAQAILADVAVEVRRSNLPESHSVSKRLETLTNIFDYSEYGGAPLFGVKGAAMICHGGSDSKTIFNAVRAVRKFHSLRINSQFVEAIGKYCKTN